MSIGNVQQAGKDSNLPVSFNQEKRLLFEELATARSFQVSPFNGVLSLELSGNLDVSTLEKALNELACRHAALRARIRPTPDMSVIERRASLITFARTGLFVPGLYKQNILPAVKIPLAVHSIEALDGPAQITEIDRILTESHEYRFAFDAPPPARADLIRRGASKFLLIIAVSHLVADLWSLKLIEHEISCLYNHLAYPARSNLLPAPQIQFHDFAYWQHRYLPTSAFQESQEFWKAQWAVFESGQLRHDELPAAPSVRSPRSGMGTLEISLRPEMWKGLQVLTRECMVTLSMVLRAMLTAVWHKYTGRSHLASWGNFANRVRPGTNAVVGWFTNSHLIGLDLTDNPTFRELLAQTRGTVLDALKHQETPTTLLFRQFGRVPGRLTNIVIDSVPEIGRKRFADSADVLEVRAVTLPQISSRISWVRGLYLLLNLDSGGETLTALYSTDAFVESGIAKMFDDLREVIDWASRHLDCRISTFGYL